MDYSPVTIQKNSTPDRLGKALPDISDPPDNLELERTSGSRSGRPGVAVSGVNCERGVCGVKLAGTPTTNWGVVVVAGGGVVGLLNLTVRKKSAAACEVGYCGV